MSFLKARRAAGAPGAPGAPGAGAPAARFLESASDLYPAAHPAGHRQRHTEVKLHHAPGETSDAGTTAYTANAQYWLNGLHLDTVTQQRRGPGKPIDRRIRHRYRPDGELSTLFENYEFPSGGPVPGRCDA